MKFSVLMSVYKKESPSFLDRAINSIYFKQTVKPTEIILVQDGVLTEELYLVLDKWSKILPDTFTTIEISKNVGLGKALNIGLSQCHNELVARMDTDDISKENRFELQLKEFNENKNLSACGGWVSEFTSDETIINGFRKVPFSNIGIIKRSKMKNPINHPTIMFKKHDVLASGGYLDMPYFEDYYLWCRMLSNGFQFYNIPEVLVNMRAGSGQLSRRSGISYAKKELSFFSTLLHENYINKLQFVRAIMLRVPIRLFPRELIKKIYKLLRK
jgi:glycosyltransferase involved in cell wall biosynthesis